MGGRRRAVSSGAGTVHQWARDIERFADDWPAQGATVLQRAVEQQLRADTGGDGGLSHARDLGRASVDVDPGRASADVLGAGSMAVWVMLEHGTRGHDVRAGRGRVLRTPYGPRRVVHVSGMAAKRTWSSGVQAGMPQVARDGEAAWSRVGG
jgi:hypothetical protein